MRVCFPWIYIIFSLSSGFWGSRIWSSVSKTRVIKPPPIYNVTINGWYKPSKYERWMIALLTLSNMNYFTLIWGFPKIGYSLINHQFCGIPIYGTPIWHMRRACETQDLISSMAALTNASRSTCPRVRTASNGDSRALGLHNWWLTGW